MSLLSRDRRYGYCDYVPAWKWEEDENAITNMFTDIWSPQVGRGLVEIFGTIYFEHKKLGSDGTLQTSYEDVGFTLDNIIDAYLELYDERLVAFPYYFDGGTGQQRSKSKIQNAIKTVLTMYRWKYFKMVETMGFVYNPIENYNMSEEGTDTDTPTGTSSKSHQINATKVGSIKITGKGTGIDIEKNLQTNQFEITDVDIDENGRKKTLTDATSDTRNNAAAQRSAWTPGSGEEPGTEGVPAIDNSGTANKPVKTSNYVTTMDSAAENRLHNYTIGEGSVAQGFYSNVFDDIPPMVEITAGNPAFASYTDTESFTNRKNEKEHELTRSGNIGVTTTQQMIEQERNIIRFSVLKEFFEDLNKVVLLGVWD